MGAGVGDSDTVAIYVANQHALDARPERVSLPTDELIERGEVLIYGLAGPAARDVIRGKEHVQLAKDTRKGFGEIKQC